MVILKKILIPLIIISFLFSQDSTKTYTFTEEEVQIFYTSIQELEHKSKTDEKIIENLNSQIYMYIQTIENDSLLIIDYKRQLELKNDMIKLVKPKWYDNKYLWFGYGITLTAGAVILAGQLK